jgi:predicted alpha/beta-fold hydrolase
VPVIRSTFAPPFLLRGAHAQTLLGAVLPRGKSVRYARERLELADGDFVDLDWSRIGADRLVIISHGLESASSDSLTRGVVAAVNAAGWDALAWNFRGCSGEPNRLPRFYHSGETGDLAEVIARAARDHSRIALVGFSLGGNMTLKYLGEAPPHPGVCGAVAVSAPIDLASSARRLDAHSGNRFYLRRFLRKLAAKVEAKALHFPDAFDTRGLRGISSFAEFDDRFTARLHGFRDAADYWAQSSARPLLSRIGVPALLINALDDPFLAPESFPEPEALANAFLTLETPRHGGHLGFIDARGSWLARRIVEFLGA